MEEFAWRHWGIQGLCLVNLPMKQIIPCALHLIMQVTRKLFKLLAQELQGAEN
jgi:hypothetical protein